LSTLHLLRDAVRAKEIVAILLKYRFDEFLEHIDTPAAWLRKIAPPVRGAYTLERRLRMAIEELGPTFIKIGQVLSTRPDILPAAWIEELEGLREQVRPVPFAEIRPALERELGSTLEETFTEFDEKPCAAGSIGQIYQAVLAADGRKVAVKIQRPGIRKPVMTDLELLVWFADQLHANVAALQPLDLPAVVEELRQGLLHELDFTIEARNAAVFNSLNKFSEQVFAPEVLQHFTTPRLLVTEWVDGTSVHRLPKVFTDGPRLAAAGGGSFFSQIVLTGFFHGDPHPGNLLVTPDGRICFLDWGLAGQLTRSMRYALIDLFDACGRRDASKVAQIALRMGRRSRRVERVDLEKAITTTLFKYDIELRRMENLGRVIFELIYVFGSNGIHVARDYTLLAKAVISIERTARLLDPGFNLATVGKPFVRELNWERLNPLQISRNLLSEWQERWARLLELPEDMQRVLHRLEDGELAMTHRISGFDQASNTFHHAFSRLSLAVIIGALIIGSSIVITTGIQPLLWGYPAIGILGYLLSAAIGVYVTFDILRGGGKTK
jgi:ubiquinone biosynthesis protein